MTKISPWGRTLERLLCTQRPSECRKLKTNGGKDWFLPRKFDGKFIEWILYFPSLIFTLLFNCDFKAMGSMTVCLFVMILFYF